MKTKEGQEPILVIQMGENESIAAFIVADGVTVCKLDPHIPAAVLTLLAAYFLVDLTYPLEYAQVLGLIQHICLAVEFRDNERKTGFSTLLQVL